MVREVPYGTLAREDRRARHLAADDLEGEDGAEELSGIAAWHLLDVLGATTAAQNPAHEEVVLQAIQRMTLAPSAF